MTSQYWYDERTRAYDHHQKMHDTHRTLAENARAIGHQEGVEHHTNMANMHLDRRNAADYEAQLQIAYDNLYNEPLIGGHPDDSLSSDFEDRD
jgi:hypothetical protein